MSNLLYNYLLFVYLLVMKELINTFYALAWRQFSTLFQLSTGGQLT